MKVAICVIVAICLSGALGQQAPPAPTPPPLGSRPPPKSSTMAMTPGAPSTQRTFPTPPRPTLPPKGMDGSTPASSAPAVTAKPAPGMVPSEDCLNKKSDCRLYGSKSCSGIYEPWAKVNCPRYCGFCIHPNDTQIECKDNIDICNQYQSDLCTNVLYRIFAEDNCRKYCNLCDSDIRAGGQGISSDQSPQLSPSATQAPVAARADAGNSTDCKDTVDYCWTEPDSNCFGIFEPWSRTHCPYRCFFCPDKPPCEDKLDYCAQYDQSVCTDDSFLGWARTNCRKFCKLCDPPLNTATNARTVWRWLKSRSNGTNFATC